MTEWMTDGFGDIPDETLYFKGLGGNWSSNQVILQTASASGAGAITKVESPVPRRRDGKTMGKDYVRGA